MLDIYCSHCIIFHFQAWHHGRDHHQDAKYSYWRSSTTNICRAWSATFSSGGCHIRSWSCLPRNCTAQNGWSAAVRDWLVWIYAVIIHYNRVVYHLREISWWGGGGGGERGGGRSQGEFGLGGVRGAGGGSHERVGSVKNRQKLHNNTQSAAVRDRLAWMDVIIIHYHRNH